MRVAPSSSERTGFALTSLAVLVVTQGTSLAPGVPFVRGDADESGAVDVTDAVSVIRHVFQPGAATARCLDAADADDSGTIDLGDPVYLLAAIFRGGPAPPAPFPACGEDPTDDALGCEAFVGCYSMLAFGAHCVRAGCVVIVIESSDRMARFGELTVASRHATALIASLDEATEFGVVFFDAGIRQVPPERGPVAATPEAKSAAAELISRTTAGGSDGCVAQGLEAGLQMAIGSPRGRKVVLYLGRGRGECQGADEERYLTEALRSLTELNSGRARIFTVGVLDVTRVGDQFLRDLAASNGGEYLSSVR